MKNTKLNWKGDKIKKNIKNASKNGLQEAGQAYLEESNKIIPYDTGEARESGKVIQSEDSAYVSYDAPHVVKIHETPMNFQGGRKHKFLEDTMNNNPKKLEQELAEKFRRELGG